MGDSIGRGFIYENGLPLRLHVVGRRASCRLPGFLRGQDHKEARELSLGSNLACAPVRLREIATLRLSRLLSSLCQRLTAKAHRPSQRVLEVAITKSGSERLSDIIMQQLPDIVSPGR